MPIDVVMPQMGESIAEGTIVRWIKHVGERIDRDEPLFEISTDKVDAEIPSPGAGVLLAITVREGETVPVNSLVAVIGEEGEELGVRAELAEPAAPGSVDSLDDDLTGPSTAASFPRPAQAGLDVGMATLGSENSGSDDQSEAAGRESLDELHRLRSSPVVRKIARDHGIDLRQVTGTGISGRVTKHDIDEFIANAAHGGRHRDADAGAPARRPSLPTAAAYQPGDAVRIEKMSVMRRKIADHMVMSAHTSPHVYSTYEVDFGGIDVLRREKQAEYEAAGVKLTYTAFIAKATVATIRDFPIVNAALDGDNIVYKTDINLGIAVALEQGLIVPVIRKADECSMFALARAIHDLARRARSKQLDAGEVHGGTFTITNQGVFGALIGLPIINQPQVAILALGAIEKRAVVVDDQVVVRPTCYLTLGFDHRLIDGADGGRFMQALKERIENFDPSWL
jgi:pyruvate dehydrogenase E2 component (dihydrolipoamide acetyltransferase)